jgi:hypothetical protein
VEEVDISEDEIFDIEKIVVIREDTARNFIALRKLPKLLKRSKHERVDSTVARTATAIDASIPKEITRMRVHGGWEEEEPLVQQAQWLQTQLVHPNNDTLTAPQKRSVGGYTDLKYIHKTHHRPFVQMPPTQDIHVALKRALFKLRDMTEDVKNILDVPGDLGVNQNQAIAGGGPVDADAVTEIGSQHSSIASDTREVSDFTFRLYTIALDYLFEIYRPRRIILPSEVHNEILEQFRVFWNAIKHRQRQVIVENRNEKLSFELFRDWFLAEMKKFKTVEHNIAAGTVNNKRADTNLQTRGQTMK